IRLLELVRDLGQSGDLERLEAVLKAIPKGKNGQILVKEVRQLIDTLGNKIDKIADLVEAITSDD
ncbi:MAG: hypothetical protein ACTSYX_05595, partial [Candidatus Thorarchaeota archaeon]